MEWPLSPFIDPLLIDENERDGFGGNAHSSFLSLVFIVNIY